MHELVSERPELESDVSVELLADLEVLGRYERPQRDDTVSKLVIRHDLSSEMCAIGISRSTG
jgi:hypothetical protein